MHYELVIIGAGLMGIRSALTAKELGIQSVLLVDYEKEIGGFGSSLFEREEFQKEKGLIERAKKLPYECWQQATVVGFFAGENGETHEFSIQTPTGTKEILADKIILSSGTLEKPREAHQIGGTRPSGIMTPLMALSLLERNQLPGYQSIVFENGKVSAAVANLLEEHGSHVTRIDGEIEKVIDIQGNSRISKVTFENVVTGEFTSYECDTLVFSEGAIPCTFYLKGTSIERDEHHFIVVDEKGKTNIPGIVALGSCTNKTDKFDYHSEAQSHGIIRELMTV
ncbi:NAD(P)/FAD-dependent oxidoreductase [Alkalihalobacillus oceani]|uniref:NAD(P)/FAD-dependent oxidoreductase n=1 Tax=Halalkalibacter oceani TaxID=1653776 RepID=UPI00203AFEE7|nr:FAD-dependent oxidoreductase [Halalkalibacter oceani]MCM3761099.1 NAD(P)/FAD-dependent oxidoreductase [Halalkalibacter oceani]